MTTNTSELRALDILDDIGPTHRLHLIPDDRHEPHLHLGEFAVVDLTDRGIVFGEVYLIMQTHGPIVWQVNRSRGIFADKPGREPTATLSPLNRTKFLANGDVDWSKGVRLSDGPIYLHYLEERIIGRVIGIFQAPGDPVLPPPPTRGATR